MAAAPSSSLAQEPRNEVAAASSIPRPMAQEASHGAPIKKMATEASQDGVPDQATETSSTRRDPRSERTPWPPRTATTATPWTSRQGARIGRWRTQLQAGRKARLRLLEREWCGKMGRFKTQSEPLTRNTEQMQ
ncbi:hypothetical protein IscW_ISCW006316 [Ixodes scapularis]|uniref:Uncharacterized protein n=1 Tax=Ixodes scapularis TaxID=6945 RepID=B7PMV5_IXOSC|nr:hypothetical protein IscW_ISCW006316 [Ixodes scapularis]|eukprot:XP_002435103.1 hypothetical protein IscW_ISCW006316 [Ixodes scapularis]